MPLTFGSLAKALLVQSAFIAIYILFDVLRGRTPDGHDVFASSVAGVAITALARTFDLGKHNPPQVADDVRSD